MDPVTDSPAARKFKFWYTWNRVLIIASSCSLLVALAAFLTMMLHLASVPVWVFVASFSISFGAQIPMTRDVWCPACQGCFYGNQYGQMHFNMYARKCQHCGYVPRRRAKPEQATPGAPSK